ncbi:RdRp [Drosophila suzukii associated hytrosavirus 1]|nr:RdRp [Drosophila suzukii associated hytrosavirus 1]
MDNYLKNGQIKYKFQRILLDKHLNSKYLFSHNDILGMLRVWNGSTNQNKKHLLLRSNYPWLFSSKNEIKNNEDLNAHKILPIIALSEIGRKSLTALKNVILHDKYAHIIELLTHVGVFKKWSKSLSKISTATKSHPCLVHGVNIMMKKKIMYYASVKSQIPDFINCQEILNCIYANDEERLHRYYVDILSHYNLSADVIDKYLNSTEAIHFIRSICEIVLGNNRKIISYLQGKESAVRTAVPKRVLSCRAQICLAPFLTATQIGIPYWWAKYVHFEQADGIRDLKIYRSNAIQEKLPEYYVYKLHGQRILAKRDPIIHILAFCVFDQVYFHADSRFKVGAESLKKMAADFDGDTFILYFINDLKVMHEIDFNASPRYSMALHGQCRINLIESIVLAMYKRDVTEKIPHWRLYNFIRQRFIYKWMCNIRNCSTLEAIAKISNGEFPLRRLYNMIEPTDLILSEMLMVIYTMYGSTESYNFYCELLRLSMELSIKFEDATLYQPNLPCDYTLTDNLLNFNLLAVSFSCAKGSIHTYKSLLDKIYEKDQNTNLYKEPMETDENFDYEKLIADITNANIYAAKKSKQVPQQGYNLFKDTIEGDLMSFGGNRLNYENEILIEDIYLKIPLQYILKSSIAYTILYE